MSRRVLVVDDDRATRHLLRHVLGEGGFEVVTASDGATALRKLRAATFDLVVLDIWMPRMSGLEVLSRLRNDGPAVRAIVMTSDDTSATMLAAIREQAYDYVGKPLDTADVLERVKNALEAAPAPPIEVVSGRPDWVELLVPCELASVERIQSFMARMEADLPAAMRESIGFVFHELLVNAVEWGGKLDPNSKVRISCIRAKRMVLYRITDPGSGFRIEELTHAAISYASEDVGQSAVVRQQKGLRPGGFGLLLARGMVDELIYSEKRNDVVFVKYLDGQ